MDAMRLAFRHAWRRIWKRPGPSLLAICALGLGIGLVTTMFNTVYGVVLRGLPFEDAERLFHLEGIDPETGDTFGVDEHDFVDWRAQQSSFEDLTAFVFGATVNLSDDELPQRYDGAYLGADVFDVLRVKPILGRDFVDGEDRPGADPVVILGYGVWRERYGGDPAIIGRVVRVNGVPTTVVGVMAEGFRFPVKQDVWLPLEIDLAKNPRGEGQPVEIMGRLRPGVSLEQAREEMSTIAARLAETYPESNEGVGARVQPFAKEFIPDEVTSLFFTMLGAVAFVLLIACANVASLLLARATSRGPELATRQALGADRRFVVGDLLAEGLVLAGFGALLGVGIAHLGGSYMRALIDARPEPPYWVTVGLEPPVLAFVAGVTVLAGLFAGLLPAFQVARADDLRGLLSDGRSAAGLRIGRFSRWAVVGQIALAAVLLAGAGLMVRSVVALRTADLGFQSANLLTARVGLSETAYPEDADRLRFFERLLEDLRAAPGVVSATAASSLPTTGFDGTGYRVEGKDYSDRRDRRDTNLSSVTPEFFAAFGIPILRGRGFSDRDREGAPPVVIVNRSFAEREWPGEDPLGKRLRFGFEDEDEPWRQVVGLVPDARMNELDDPTEDGDGLYVPLAQNPRRFLSVVIKTHGEPEGFTPLLRAKVAALDPDLPIYWGRTMTEVVAEGRFFHEFFGGLFAVFGAAALLLAAVGIYGITAFAVGQRRREIGVRMALGARPTDVQSMVLRQGAARLALGLAIGLVPGLLISRLLREFLFAVEPGDPATVALIVASLSGVALLACFFPARRAMRVDPIETLRQE